MKNEKKTGKSKKMTMTYENIKKNFFTSSYSILSHVKTQKKTYEFHITAE